MSNRVTSDEVKEIIETSLTDVGAFITAANLMVTNFLSGESLTDAHLKEVERWLAAHLIAMRERQIQMTKTGESMDQYGGRFGKGLEFTQYGQQVLIMDTTGKLKNAGKIKSKIETIFDLPDTTA